MKRIATIALCASLAVCLTGCITVKGGNNEPEAEPAKQEAQGTQAEPEADAPDATESAEQEDALDTAIEPTQIDIVSIDAPLSWTKNGEGDTVSFVAPGSKAMMLVQVQDVADTFAELYSTAEDTGDDIDEVRGQFGELYVASAMGALEEGGMAYDSEIVDVNGNPASIATFVNEEYVGGAGVILIDESALVTVTVGGNGDNITDEEHSALIDMFGEVVQSIAIA